MRYKKNNSKKIANKLRKYQSPEEKLLLMRLNRWNRKIHFRRSLFGYIPCFVFPNTKSIIEPGLDMKRDENLIKRGYRILRIDPKRVSNDLDNLLIDISNFSFGCNLEAGLKPRKDIIKSNFYV